MPYLTSKWMEQYGHQRQRIVVRKFCAFSFARSSFGHSFYNLPTCSSLLSTQSYVKIHSTSPWFSCICHSHLYCSFFSHSYHIYSSSLMPSLSLFLSIFFHIQVTNLEISYIIYFIFRWSFVILFISNLTSFIFWAMAWIGNTNQKL